MVDLAKIKKDIKEVLCLYHFFNIFFALSFIFSKNIYFLSELLYSEEHREVSSREREILMFLGVIIIWKGRKTSGMLHYLSNIYFYSKFGNAILFFMIGPLYGILYSLIVIAIIILFPEPILADFSNITFFQGESFYRELERDKSVVWVIEFFTTWSSECKYVAPVFAKLSEQYSLNNLRFGKINVGRYPKEGERFRINTHPMSKQLPSISIFRNGIQENRRPAVGSNQRIIPFAFTEENCIIELGLNDIYKECKNKLKKYEKLKDL